RGAFRHWLNGLYGFAALRAESCRSGRFGLPDHPRIPLPGREQVLRAARTLHQRDLHFEPRSDRIVLHETLVALEKKAARKLLILDRTNQDLRPKTIPGRTLEALDFHSLVIVWQHHVRLLVRFAPLGRRGRMIGIG